MAIGYSVALLRRDSKAADRLIAWKTKIRDGEIVLGPSYHVVLGKRHRRSRTQVPGLTPIHFRSVGERDRWAPDGSDGEVGGAALQGPNPRVALNAGIQGRLRCGARTIHPTRTDVRKLRLVQSKPAGDY